MQDWDDFCNTTTLPLILPVKCEFMGKLIRPGSNNHAIKSYAVLLNPHNWACRIALTTRYWAGNCMMGFPPFKSHDWYCQENDVATIPPHLHPTVEPELQMSSFIDDGWNRQTDSRPTSSLYPRPPAVTIADYVSTRQLAYPFAKLWI